MTGLPPVVGVAVGFNGAVGLIENTGDEVGVVIVGKSVGAMGAAVGDTGAEVGFKVSGCCVKKVGTGEGELGSVEAWFSGLPVELVGICVGATVATGDTDSVATGLLGMRVELGMRVGTREETDAVGVIVDPATVGATVDTGMTVTVGLFDAVVVFDGTDAGTDAADAGAGLDVACLLVDELGANDIVGQGETVDFEVGATVPVPAERSCVDEEGGAGFGRLNARVDIGA